jgi:hypothetical protein
MAKSGIYIKPSKRGTFTAAAKRHGKSVQGFASQVLANKGNYSPAMVKKANFARNASKWKKEFGGFIDNQLGAEPVDTPIGMFQLGGDLTDSNITPEERNAIVEGLKLEDKSEKQLQRLYRKLEKSDVPNLGGRGVSESIREKNLDITQKQKSVVQEYLDQLNQVDAVTGPDVPMYQWGGTFGKGSNAVNLNTSMLAERHEDLKNLKYLDLPDTDWGSLAMNIGGAALSAYGGAGGTFGGRIGEGASGAFANIGSSDIAGLGSAMMGAGAKGLAGANVVGGPSTLDYAITSGALSGMVGGQQLSNQSGIGYGDGKVTLQDYLKMKKMKELEEQGQLEDGGQIPQESPWINISSQEDYDSLFGQMIDEEKEGYLPVYQEGGQLLGYLPEYGFGSWLGDNAGKILKGVGGVVSVIPGFGQIAGPILIGAGAATDAIVGHVRKKRAEEELETAEQREEKMAGMRDDAERYRADFDASKNIAYGATFEMGGGLMENVPRSNQAPMITEYGSGSNSHQEGVGGVPVDAKGNPATVSRQSVVGLTEKGEVTWNGYVFSDKLTT